MKFKDIQINDAKLDFESLISTESFQFIWTGIGIIFLLILLIFYFSVCIVFFTGLRLYTELATTLFYLIVDQCLTEEATSCPPLRYLISGCLETLGENVVSDQPSECVAILERLTSRPTLSPILSQFFCPNVVDTATFVEVYKKISQLPDSESNLAFVLLSKVSCHFLNKFILCHCSCIL